MYDQNKYTKKDTGCKHLGKATGNLHRFRHGVKKILSHLGAVTAGHTKQQIKKD